MEDLAGHVDLLIQRAIELKRGARRGKLPQLLAGKSVVVVFEKNSTRTRVSFEIGIQRLGGIACVLDAQSSQLARGESMQDTARVLSRYADALVYRATAHGSLTEMARHATVPVVNALTDREHPCQVLADLATLHEHVTATGGPGLEGRTLTYVGDGNNMCNSYLLGAPLAGMNVHVATPRAYAPSLDIVARAKQLARARGTRVLVTTDPMKAVRGADAVATDTWVSMGDEGEAAEREAAFAGFTVDDRMMDHAGPGAVFLHCLPGHWGQEATEEIAHGPRSLIYDEAENRMWTQMALLAHLIGSP